jgi:predicted nucleotidyltransferase
MSVLDTAVEIASFLDEQGVPYAVIGGLAVQYWGEPRTTMDVDIVVLVSPDRTQAFLEAAVRRFTARLQDAVSFAQTNRMLLLSDADGTPIDISLGIPGYEEGVLQRAVTVTLPDNRVIRLVSPEDLIIHKCIAGRPRDKEDVERVLVRQRLSVEVGYIRQWLGAFAELMEHHDVVSIFEDAVNQATAELAQDAE